MKLTRNKIFLGTLIFGLISNILMYSDIRFFYIRPIMSFLYLTFIPGFLMMMIFKKRNIRFWEYLVYSVGLSVAFLIFTGLMANWLLPLINITQPLSFYPLSIFTNFIISILWLIAYVRNKKVNIPIKIGNFSALDLIFFLLPIIFLVLSITGAINLNNNGSNYLTVFSIMGISLYVFPLMLLRKRLNKNIFPWSLFLISASLLYMGSLRGWYISHTDAALEYAVFKLTLTKGFWNFLLANNTYNGMLSVTILPVALINFLAINEYYISKVVFPLIFSFVPVTTYVLFRKLFGREVSFLGSLFFAFQPAFTAWTLISPRQEIALLFFALILLSIFSNKISSAMKNIFIFIFGASMIVSHYTTSYLATFIFTILLMLSFIYTFLKGRRVRSYLDQKDKYKNLKPYAETFFLLLIFEIIWYFKVTTIGGGAIEFTRVSISNINKILDENVYSQGNSPLAYLNALGIGKTNPFDPIKSLDNYIFEMGKLEGNNNYPKEEVNKYLLIVSNTSSLSTKENPQLSALSKRFEQIVIVIGGMLILLGSFFYLFFTKPSDNKYKLHILIFLTTLGVFTVLPFVSIYYDFHRVYQQVLTILSVAAIYGLTRLLKKNESLTFILFSVFIVAYLLIFTHLQYTFIGGNEIQLRFANVGKDYDLHYVKKGEISSADWLFGNIQEGSSVVSDNYANFKIYQSSNFNFNTELKIDVLPEVIDKDDYVYSSRANNLQGIAFRFYGGGLLIYDFPNDFLAENKNKIYNNGISVIYK